MTFQTSEKSAALFADADETAQILNVSTSFLNKARVFGGGPPFVKMGKIVRYHVPTAIEWALSRQRRSTSDSGDAA
jgi:hypothetical protein